MSFIPRWNQKWHPQKKFYGIEKDYHQVHPDTHRFTWYRQKERPRYRRTGEDKKEALTQKFKPKHPYYYFSDERYDFKAATDGVVRQLKKDLKNEFPHPTAAATRLAPLKSESSLKVPGNCKSKEEKVDNKVDKLADKEGIVKNILSRPYILRSDFSVTGECQRKQLRGATQRKLETREEKIERSRRNDNSCPALLCDVVRMENERTRKPREEKAVRSGAESKNVDGDEIERSMHRPEMTEPLGLNTRGRHLYDPEHLQYATLNSTRMMTQERDLYRRMAMGSSPKYPLKSGIVPKYAGYVPGDKFRVGATFGRLTINAKEVGVPISTTWGGMTSVNLGKMW